MLVLQLNKSIDGSTIKTVALNYALNFLVASTFGLLKRKSPKRQYLNEAYALGNLSYLTKIKLFLNWLSGNF